MSGEFIMPDDGAYADTQYDQLGQRKVGQRQILYACTRARKQLSGEAEPVVFDMESFTVDALHRAGITRESTIVDIGCSDPQFLEQMWRGAYGHSGTLIGVDPNVKQFGLRPYWQFNNENYTYRLVGEGPVPESLQGIELIQGTADRMPRIESGSVDAATLMFMFYHVPPQKQPAAFREIKRILKPEGVMALATRGEENKAWIAEREAEIAAELTKLTGRRFHAPARISSGFTSEKAALILPEHFKHVYEYKHPDSIIIDDEWSMDRLRTAFRSMFDVYRDQSNRYPTPEEFDRAMFAVLAPFTQSGDPIVDKIRESLFIASDRELNLPEFEKLA